MELAVQVMSIENIDEIIAFEKKFSSHKEDDLEAAMAQWDAPWRQESLEHYLPLGWSFMVNDRDQKSSMQPNGSMEGYFLGQPFLFFQSKTQTLWVESIRSTNKEVEKLLIEVAYKAAREKHFQRVLFDQFSNSKDFISEYGGKEWMIDIAEIRTTKY